MMKHTLAPLMLSEAIVLMLAAGSVAGSEPLRVLILSGRLNHDRNRGKPFFDPVCLTDGTRLPWDAPPDHLWHHGLWFSWKYINGLDYWEEDRETGLSAGRNELVAVSAAPHDDHSAEIKMTINYHPPNGPPVLTEARAIRITVPAADGSYRFDWAATFTAGRGNVLFDRTAISGEPQGKAWGGYAGLSVRIAKDISQWQVISSEGEKDMEAHGKPARWMDFSGSSTQGKEAGIAVFDHPENMRHPSPWYVTVNTKVPFGYFSPAVLFKKPYRLRSGGSFTLKYRILVHPGQIGRDRLESEAQSFGSMWKEQSR